jgi:hypothetical protein
MKLTISILALVMIALLQSCSTKHEKANLIGFWEGPHHEDVNKKFYIKIMQENDSVTATGFCTNHQFYDSEFKIDSISLKADSIRFFIPNWD